jgi:carboxypeptidase Q
MAVAIVLLIVLGQTMLHSVNCIDCNLSAELLSEIRSYEEVVRAIEQLVVDEYGSFRNLTWTKLANFVDDFGTRLSGSQSLEDAIDYLLDEFTSFGLDNVHTENVSVAYWVR